jgi:hypothetical protein
MCIISFLGNIAFWTSFDRSAKYEFASSNTTRTTFEFDALYLAPLPDERSGFFHIKSIATIDAIEHVLNVANSYLAYWSSLLRY